MIQYETTKPKQKTKNLYKKICKHIKEQFEEIDFLCTAVLHCKFYAENQLQNVCDHFFLP